MNSIRNILLINSRYNINEIHKRTLKKEIRNKMKDKQSSKHLALEYFDFFYGSAFGAEWNKMRLAMLTGSGKYAALINNYANIEKSKKKLENQASIDLFDFALKYELNQINNSDNDTENNEEALKKLELLKELKIPPALKLYCFENGDTNRFDEPKIDDSQLLNYYCMDASSILPVLAMNIQKDDHILDLCASPGGKTLAMLQTLLPRKITCRDINAGRMQRLKRMLGSYIKQDDIEKLIEFEYNEENYGFNPETKNYDKVLVDVPCSNDKKSLSEDNNIFSRKRVDERTELPSVQTALLKQGIDLCKPNGYVVYSTCSLSPIQNEGVINGVLEEYETNNKKFRLEVQSLDHIKVNFDYFFSFSSSCEKGLLVQPEISRNYGPFYLCKIFKSPK